MAGQTLYLMKRLYNPRLEESGIDMEMAEGNPLQAIDEADAPVCCFWFDSPGGQEPERRANREHFAAKRNKTHLSVANKIDGSMDSFWASFPRWLGAHFPVRCIPPAVNISDALTGDGGNGISVR